MAYIKDVSTVYPVRTFGRSWIVGFASPPAYTVGTRTFRQKRTRSGVSQPKWEEIIHNGGNATTVMNAEWESMSHSKGGCTIRYKSDVYPTYVYTFECGGDLPLISGLDTPNFRVATESTAFVWNLAAAKFRSKLRSEYTQMQGMVALGELRETLRMLRSPAQGVRTLAQDFLDLLKKRKKADPKRWMNSIGSAWLEHAFGWSPLINDVNSSIDAYKALRDRLTKPSLRHISASVKKSYDQTNSLSGINRVGGVKVVNNGPYYRCVLSHAREKHIVRFRGAVSAQAEMPGWQEERDAYGFNVAEFIPTVWELLPWSFLADYFVNIGDCLNAMTTFTGNVNYVNQTLITETFFRGEWEPDIGLTKPGGAGNWYFSGIDGGSRVKSFLKRRVISRTPGVGVPLPHLQFNYHLADGQLLNVAALLSQAKALHPQNITRVWHR